MQDRKEIIKSCMTCAWCGRKNIEVCAHHEPPKGRSGKKSAKTLAQQDRRMVPLCADCHHERHFGVISKSVREKMREKLGGMARDIDVIIAIYEIVY